MVSCMIFLIVENVYRIVIIYGFTETNLNLLVGWMLHTCSLVNNLHVYVTKNEKIARLAMHF